MYILSLGGHGLTLKAINNLIVQFKHLFFLLCCSWENVTITQYITIIFIHRTALCGPSVGRCVETLHRRHVADFLQCYCIGRGIFLKLNYFPGCDHEQLRDALKKRLLVLLRESIRGRQRGATLQKCYPRGAQKQAIKKCLVHDWLHVHWCVFWQCEIVLSSAGILYAWSLETFSTTIVWSVYTVRPSLHTKNFHNS